MFKTLGKITFVACFAIASQNTFAQIKASAGMGKGLYESKDSGGSNSCLFCHGIAGDQGNVKDAAKLTHPKTWKIYAALGGDAEYKKNPTKFVESMKAATTHIIRVGAIRHNSTYKAEGYDKSKIQNFNAQMMGLSGAASVAWMKKFQDKGMTPEIAAEAAWLHLVSFDQDGILKK